MKIKSIIFAGLLAAGQAVAGPFTYFETGFEYAGGAPTVGNMISNLNGADGQIGTWTGNVPVGNGGDTEPEYISFPTVAGSTFMLADRGISDSIFTANLTESVGLPGTEVTFDLGIRRTGGNHTKDITIVGFDSIGFETFHVIVSTRNTAPALRRLGVQVGGSDDYNLDTSVGNDANNDMPNSGAGLPATSVASISLSLSATGYILDFSRDTRAYTTTEIAYNGTPMDLTRIDITAQGGPLANDQSGFFLDNLHVTAIPEPSTALPLMLLAIIGIRRFTKKSA